GEINLNQIPNYYTLSPEIKELNGDANCTLSVKGPANDPASMDFSGNLTVKNVNIQGQSLAADVTGLNGTFTLSPDKAVLESLHFNIGSSDVTVSGSLQNYMQYLQKEADRTVTPRLEGQFSSNYFNVDELVDWSDTTTSSFTLELPDLTSSVQADIEKLVVHGVTMQNLQAHAATTPEQIELTQGRVNLFGGKADGKLRWKI